MSALAYHISPELLTQRPFYARLLWGALPEFTALMPGYSHIVAEYGPVVKPGFEASGPPQPSFGGEWRKLAPPRGLPWNRATAYRKKMANWLKEEKIQVLITADKELVSKDLGTKVVLLSSANQLLGGQAPKKTASLPQWTTASRILVPLETDRDAVISAFPMLKNTVSAWYPSFTGPFQQAGRTEKEEIQTAYTHGREYFLYSGPWTNTEALVILLKAFSLVKKWLKTSMPLVLAGPGMEGTAAVEGLIKNYRYREDILLYPGKPENELQELIRGAYALILTAPAAADVGTAHGAFSAGVPVVVAGNPVLLKLLGEAVLLSPESDIEMLANHLMLIFKNEQLCRSLVEKGRMLSESLQAETTLMAYRNLVKGLIA